MEVMFMETGRRTKQSLHLVSKNGSVGQTKGSRLKIANSRDKKTEPADEVSTLEIKE